MSPTGSLEADGNRITELMKAGLVVPFGPGDGARAAEALRVRLEGGLSAQVIVELTEIAEALREAILSEFSASELLMRVGDKRFKVDVVADADSHRHNIRKRLTTGRGE